MQACDLRDSSVAAVSVVSDVVLPCEGTQAPRAFTPGCLQSAGVKGSKCVIPSLAGGRAGWLGT